MTRTKAQEKYGDFMSQRTEKKLRFFPELHNRDKYITEFFAGQEGHKFDGPLDPDKVHYSAPDFGFNNALTFEDDDEFEVEGDDGNAGWRKFMDCVSMFPRFQRVQNYIGFINEKKLKGLLIA